MEYESTLKQKFCNKNFLGMSLWMTLHRRFLFNKLKFITWTNHLKQKQKWKKKIILINVTCSRVLKKKQNLLSFKLLKDKRGLSWCTGTRGNFYCFHIHTWSCDAVRECFVPLCTGTGGHNRQKDGYKVTVVIYDSKRRRQVGTPCIFHSR